jgi:hypothetical protein
VPQLRREEYHGSRGVIAFLLQHYLFTYHDTDASAGLEALVTSAAVSAFAARQLSSLRCTRSASRSAAFALLSALCAESEHNLRQVVEYGLVPFCGSIEKVRASSPRWIGVCCVCRGGGRFRPYTSPSVITSIVSGFLTTCYVCKGGSMGLLPHQQHPGCRRVCGPSEPQ